MRLTLMTDYALRLLMYVAEHEDRLCTISEIAEAHGISVSHLSKVTHQLGQQGWITTIRGKGGGMKLGRLPQEINLGAVVRGIEPDLALVECFSENSSCGLTGRCRLAAVLEGSLQAFLQHLDSYTLADLLTNSAVPIRLIASAKDLSDSVGKESPA